MGVFALFFYSFWIYISVENNSFLSQTRRPQNFYDGGIVFYFSFGWGNNYCNAIYMNMFDELLFEDS